MSGFDPGGVPYRGGVNLTPFGHVSNVQATGDYGADALARAAQKLDDLRARRVEAQPAGRAITALIGVGVCVLAFLFFAVVGISVLPDGGFLLIFGSLFALIGFLVFLASKADTPKRALNLYYKALARGRASAATRLVVPNDFDDFPRFQPPVQNLGSGMNPRPFGQPDYFAGYWNELIRYHTMPYCLVRVKNVNSTPIADDIVLVDFDVTFMMNTQLWWLLIFVALLIAAIVDLATRKTVTVHMRKLLYRVGDEWHLFNGEWQGPEEVDLSWIQGRRFAR